MNIPRLALTYENGDGVRSRGQTIAQLLRSGHGLLVVLGCWALSIAVGTAMLAAYSQSPGSISGPQAISGVDYLTTTDAKPWHLYVGIHPKCPCTLATLSELERLMEDIHEVATCSILVFVPAGATADWTDTSSVRRAKAIPGVNVIPDVDGTSLKSLGLKTSGSTVLSDAPGTVRFHGGITPSRGHEGINLGVESIRALIQGSQPAVSETPVYGCRIVD